MNNLDPSRLKWIMELFQPTFSEIQCRAEQKWEQDRYGPDVGTIIDELTEELAYKMSDWVRGEIKDY